MIIWLASIFLRPGETSHQADGFLCLALRLATDKCGRYQEHQAYQEHTTGAPPKTGVCIQQCWPQHEIQGIFLKDLYWQCWYLCSYLCIHTHVHTYINYTYRQTDRQNMNFEPTNISHDQNGEHLSLSGDTHQFMFGDLQGSWVDDCLM